MPRKPAAAEPWKPTVGEVRAMVALVGGDGWSIYPPHEVPETIAARFTHTWQSDGTHKGSITVDGSYTSRYTGVYGLSVLESMVAALGLRPEHAPFGRGSRASLYSGILHGWLQAQDALLTPSGPIG